MPITLPSSVVLTAVLLVAMIDLLSVGTQAPVHASTVIDARLVEIAGPPAPAPPSQPAPAPPPPRLPPRRAVHRAAPSPAPAPQNAAAAAAPEAPSSPIGETADATARRANPPAGNMSARALYRPLPQVPEELRHRDAEFVAVARFRVAADGSAVVDLVEPTANPALNESLIATLRTWRFFPALESGRPIASSIDVRIPISVR